ncbi:MAG: hypothetical protein MJ229_00105 [bacterium]|nr:hypothetical protein [bacterium]
MNLKFKIFLALFIFFLGDVGFCAVKFPPLKPIENKDVLVDKKETKEEINLVNITSVEQELFGKSYSSQNLIKRLSRIEKRLFYTTFPNSPASQRVDNIVSNFNKLKQFPCISQKDLTNLEEKVLGQTNQVLSPDKRLELLEEKLFGAVQTGDVESRLKSVKIASGNVSKSVDYADNNDLWGLEQRGNIMMPISGMSVQGINPNDYVQYHPNYGYVPEFNKYMKVRPYVPHYVRHPMHRHLNPHRFYPHSSNLSQPRHYINSNVRRGVNTGIGATILN